MRQLVLAFDVPNQQFVSNYLGSSAAIPPFRQGKYQTRVYLVQPVQDSIPGRPDYEAYDSTDFDGIRFGFWKDSTGTLNDEDANVLALTPQTDWTYNADDPLAPYYEGVINTYTQEMADWIGAANNKAAYMAVNLVDGADLYPVFDQKGSTNVTVYSATDGGGGAPVDMSEEIPTIRLPCQFLDTDTGKIFSISLSAESPPTLLFTCINP